MKMKPFRFIMGCSTIQVATLAIPHDSPWYMALVAVGFGWVGTGLYQGVRYVQRERKVLMRRQRTAELEMELGLEPLNLHELDDIILDKNKEQQRP